MTNSVWPVLFNCRDSEAESELGKGSKFYFTILTDSRKITKFFQYRSTKT